MALIGEVTSGGTVFYTGATTLIAATRDIEISLYWGCVNNPISNTQTGIGSGQANTNLIFSGCTGNTMIAARVCLDLTLDGYSDWYLPSKDELNELYQYKSLIGGLDLYNNYWSSSQSKLNTAWMQFFLNGAQGEGYKDQLYKVRPIRSA